MKQAKFYVYRNLHRDCFSVKLRGKVIDWPEHFIMNNAEFKVSNAGQNRARKQKQRNVHAYVAADNYLKLDYSQAQAILEKNLFTQVYYNPFKTDTFVNCETGKPIHNVEYLLGYQNKIYVK